MTDPAPVMVTNPDPIEVKVAPAADTDAASTARIVKAKAETEAEILLTEGQRGINRLWERTQAIIAVAVVLVTLIVVSILIIIPVVRGEKVTDSAALVLLSALATNIITSYFTRTNHSRTGGPGGQEVTRDR